MGDVLLEFQSGGLRRGSKQIDEHGEYFLNIEWISNPQSPHRIFILCICLALES